MRRGTPIRTIFSIAFGSADSEEVVANAIEAGVLTALIKSTTGTLKISAIGSKISTANAINAPYKVKTNAPRFFKTPKPCSLWAIV